MLHTTIRVIGRQFFGFAAFVLVLAGGVDAATGGNVLLGRLNVADHKTVIQNTDNGAALELRVKPGQPPLRVNSTRRVPRLNSTFLNGKRAAAFAPARGSPNYTAKGYVPVHTTEYTIPILTDGAVESTEVEVVAPADGTLLATQWGNCDVTGEPGKMAATVNGKGEVAKIVVGKGLCEVQAELAVTRGQAALVVFEIAAGDPGSIEVSQGVRAVSFEPK